MHEPPDRAPGGAHIAGPWTGIRSLGPRQKSAT